MQSIHRHTELAIHTQATSIVPFHGAEACSDQQGRRVAANLFHPVCAPVGLFVSRALSPPSDRASLSVL